MLAVAGVEGKGCRNRAHCQEAIQSIQAAGAQGRSMCLMGEETCEVGNQEFRVGHDKSICLLDIHMRQSQPEGKDWRER